MYNMYICNILYSYIYIIFIGTLANLKPDVIEWVLAELGAVSSDLEEDPRYIYIILYIYLHV